MTTTTIKSKTSPTQSNFSIPTIDLSPLLSSSPPDPTQRKAIVQQIHHACISSGFFQLIGHNIPHPLQEAVFHGTEALFALPTEEKSRLDMKKGGGRGYEMLAAQNLSSDTTFTLPDHKEGFYIGREVPSTHPLVQEGAFLIGPNRWPDAELLPTTVFRDVMEVYYEKVLDLAATVLGLIEEGLPSDSGFDGVYWKPGGEDEGTGEDTIATLRLLHYPPSPAVKKSGLEQLGAGPHTDFGFITLLMQDSIGGLQVLDPDTVEGGEKTWHDVPPNAGAYVVNIGDMLQMYTGGRFKSSVHRVVLKDGGEGKSRYSVPFFFDGRGGFVLKKGSREGENGDREGELTVEGYMRERFRSTYGKK